MTSWLLPALAGACVAIAVLLILGWALICWACALFVSWVVEALG
jgi:hypothetical protein